MKHFWDMVTAIVVAALVVYMLFKLIAPYAIFIVIGIGVALVVKGVHRKTQHW